MLSHYDRIPEMLSRMGWDSKCALIALDCGCNFVVNTESRPKMCSHDWKRSKASLVVLLLQRCKHQGIRSDVTTPLFLRRGTTANVERAPRHNSLLPAESDIDIVHTCQVGVCLPFWLALLHFQPKHWAWHGPDINLWSNIANEETSHTMSGWWKASC